MLSCPIKNNRWNELESQLGEKKAFEEYVASNSENEQSSGFIKPGISEVFESNPELANAVYEAVGVETTENKKSVYPILNKKEAISTLQNRVKELEKELLLTFEGKGKRSEFWINEDIRTWEKIIKTLEENDNVNVTNVFKNQTLGKDLSDKKGVEVFELESNNVLKVGVLFEKTVDVINAGKKVSSPRIHPFTEFHWFKNEFAAVATKAKGVPLKRGEKLRLSELEKQNLYSDLAQIENAGLTIDISKHNNFYYNKGEGIHFIDLGAETITANEKNNNFFLDNFFENTSSEEFRKFKESFKLETQITPQQKAAAQRLYSQYLDTIFPDSKVKDIVYHGSNQKINQFEVRKEPLIHFGNKNAALQRGDVLNQVILNIKDLQTIKDGMWFLGTDEGGLLKELLSRNILTIEEVKSINEAKNKAIQESSYFHENYRMALPEGEKAGNKKLQEILKDKKIGFKYTNFSEDKGSTSYAVLSQEQIHILGSKQDIEGFKKFVKTKVLTPVSTDVKIPTAESVRSNKNSIAVLRPILDNLQDRFGIKYRFVSKEEMAEATGTDVSENLRGFISKNGVLINKDNLSMEAVFHEYAHAFIEYIDIVNPGVTSNLFNELYSTSEGKMSLDKVMNSPLYIKEGHYNPKTGEFSARGRKEAIVTMIGRLAEQDFTEVYGDVKLDKSIVDRLRQFIAEVGQAIMDMFGVDIRITPKTFNEKTTLSDISSIMALTDMYIDSRDELYDSIDLESEYLTESDLNKHAKVFDDIKIFIESRFVKLNRSNAKHKAQERYRIEKIKEVYEEQSSNVKKLTHIINYAHGELFSKDGKGYVKMLEEIVDNLNKGVKQNDPMELLKELMSYKQFAEDFGELFNEIKNSIASTMTYEEFSKESSQKDSPLWKLNEVITAVGMMKVKHKTHVIPTLATVLYPYYSKQAGTQAIREIDERLRVLREGAARIEKQSVKDKRSLLQNVTYNNIQREIEKFNNLKSKLDPSWDNLVKQLTEATEDISWFDFKLTPAVSSSDPVTASFAMLLKTKFEKMRLKLLDYQHDIKKSLNEYRKSIGTSIDNVAKFNEGLYEKVNIYRDGKFHEVLSFINEVNMSAYSVDKAAAYDERNYYMKIGKKEEADAVMDAFYKTAHVALPHSEITQMINDARDMIGKEMTKEEFNDFIVKNMYNATVYKTVNEAYMFDPDMTVDQKYNMMATELLRLHDSKGNVRYQKAFTEINKNRYINKAYQELKKNPVKFRYHEKLLERYLADQELLPPSQRNGYIIPQVRQQGWERMVDKNVISFLGEEIKDTFTWLENDEALFGTGPENYDQKFLPVYYTNFLDASETSVDLARSVLLFSKMANKFVELDSIREVTDAMQDVVAERPVRQTTPEGTGIVNSFKKKFGITSPSIKKPNEQYVNQALDSFIKMQVFGEKQELETMNVLGKTINLGKLANSLSSWVSKATIGGDFLKAVANLTQAKVMEFVEVAGGESIDRKSFLAGEQMYMTEVLPDILNKDFGKGLPESFHGRLIEAFDPLQGDWENAFGTKITRSKLLRTLSWDTYFMGIHAGEHYAQVGLMYGMMHFQKVEYKGKLIPLAKAYEQDSTGRIVLKQGIDPEWAIGGKKMLALQAKLHGLNKRLHGVYNDFDYLDAQRTSLGRLVLMFRKFAPPGFKRRFKRFGINHETGLMDEGFYKSFFDQLIKQRFNLLKVLMNNDADLTDFQKANIRKAIMEMTAMIMTGTAVFLVGGDDGTEKSYGRSFAEYQFTRLNSELMFYINPLDFMRIMSSPSASTTKIEQLARAINYQFFTWDPEKLTYQRRQGIWEKGDSKTFAAWMKLLGLTGYNLHPEEAVKILNMNR